ncbi:D-alanine--D-alanine ligase [bacterium]|nr:D-alanine--D-alanine ligase [FCB group bacterium]MBL7190665.1 D-alanine--D-alanine ligase [bacterium]
MRILVLMGGNSPERMVSLASGEAVAAGLDKMGHQVLKLDPAMPEKVYTIDQMIFEGAIGEIPHGKHACLTIEQINVLLSSIKKFSIDLIFPMLHGGWGEDGRLQALMELAGIPYVGSGPAASAAAMNKRMSKQLFSAVGIPTAEFFCLPLESVHLAPGYCDKLGYPLVVKPVHGGSTVGLTILHNPNNLERALELVKEQNDDILVEKYIPGREITVGILDGRGMAVVEIIPKDGFYDYKHKYTSGQTEYIAPAEIGDELTEKVIEYSARAFQAAGCQVYGRVDFRLNPKREFYCLEINTVPGMTAASLVPKSAAALGIEFHELVNRCAVTSVNLRRC